VLQEVRHGGEIPQLVDGGEVDSGVAQARPDDGPADTAEAVDADSRFSHTRILREEPALSSAGSRAGSRSPGLSHAVRHVIIKP
jgi:hypothetical protein